jgi:RNA polymerase sigma-70 factor (ECF subfamily)
MHADEAKCTQSAEARTDRSLLRGVRSGEQDAATLLYQRYAERLQAVAKAQTAKSLASRFDPEDVVQSVFRTFFRRASEGQYDVPKGEELWKLLLVISLNKIRGLTIFHKAAKRDVMTTVSISSADPGPRDAAQEEAVRVLEIIIEEILADLPDVHRQIIQLRIEGHRIEDVAGQTKRSQRSVERVLQLFRSRLGRLIFDESEGDAANE